MVFGPTNKAVGRSGATEEERRCMGYFVDKIATTPE